MKFSTSLALAAFAGASSVAAFGDLGFDIGVKRNSDGNCKETSDYLTDFNDMSSLTNTVRVYAVSDCNTLANMASALTQTGFQAFLGIWPNDDAHFAAELAALSTYLPTISVSNVRAFTVGSEALYRGDLSASALADKINSAKSYISTLKDKDGNSWSSVPVGTVDSWNVLVDGGNAAAIQAADIVLANAFSYWQGQTQANASYSFVDDIMQALQTIQTIKGSTDIPFWVGETGWPTAGGSYGVSVPSVENAQHFWKSAICAIRAWGINTLVFEAYDESWKPDTSGISNVEKHWGVLNDDGSAKYDLACTF
ncbi:uncharacterized protein SAPINGB_P002922 [Magnusiomyces paraingens]|uniref:glucan 1,3-beta-glucosidase n=1 Tax=Magnusiomyces paraingens TaxID=2606893 RepID=A0A5E8BGY5_9ASCO|nr:uncharacterized protein SAPINGB_P002922 [Saprochaete ingens]VVT50914.1 unnamed protein product [Saprochaete ingens]